MEHQELIENLKARGFAAQYFETAEEAKAYLARSVKNQTVGFGGSITCDELGLYDLLSAENQCFSHWRNGPAARDERVSTYLCSANAVAMSGELVNIDGTGNRVAATLYGPKRVIFVVGKNKICPDLHAAIDRARNVASPLNAKRLGAKTPCAEKGDRCYDCKSPGRICKGMVIHMGAMHGADQNEVLIIGEDLGY